MAFKKTEAIVIKATDLREADKIITFFSREYGKIQGVAKGIRKIKTRYSGKLELFTRVNVIFFEKVEPLEGKSQLLRITQVDVVEAFPELKSDFNKIIGASYIAELLNKTFEEHDHTHKEVYVLLSDTFRTLAATQNIRNIFPAFELKLLAHLGYTPILDHCIVCQTPYDQFRIESEANIRPFGFSFAEGGILCPRCKRLKKDSVEIAPESVHVLQQFLYTKITQIADIPLTKAVHVEIKTLLTHHIQYHLGVSLKTDTFVQKLRSASLSK